MDASVLVLAEPPGLVAPEDAADLQRTLSAAANLISRDTGWSYGDITCKLVTIDEICRLHAEYFDDPAPTDIITFPYAEPGPGAVVEGDIAICPDVVREQAEEYGVSHTTELAFVGVHGLLHLAGWDDLTGEDRAAMHARQAAILREIAHADEA